MTEIIVALITGGLALIGVVISNASANRRMQEQLQLQFEKAQAVTDTKIDELTREVRAHNGLVERTYNLEAQAKLLDEKLKVANHRIEDLEKEGSA